MTDKARIEILLATFNGARFLAAQLDSLLAQSERGFTVIAGDDGSNDATTEILAGYAARHPGFLRVIEAAPQRLGPSGNFARLLDRARADYIMFCDQDDVWLPEKVADTLAVMHRLEREHGPETPLLVHTDLAVVDDKLNQLGCSFVAYTGIEPGRSSLEQLLLGNIATGCTMLANRALCLIARPIPPDTLMFDHWVAQVAAATGRIGYLAVPTIQYRQHGGNAVGVRPPQHSFVLRIKRILLSDASLRVLAAYSRHAAELDKRFGARLAATERKRLLVFASIWQRPRLLRFAALWRVGLRKPSFVAGGGLFLLLLCDGASARFKRRA